MAENSDRIDVEYTAGLARLELDGSQREQLQVEMENILEYVDKLKQVDVSEVEPMAHAAELENIFREDVSRPSLSRDEMLSNAPALVSEDLVKVHPVIPGEGEM